MTFDQRGFRCGQMGPIRKSDRFEDLAKPGVPHEDKRQILDRKSATPINFNGLSVFAWLAERPRSGLGLPSSSRTYRMQSIAVQYLHVSGTVRKWFGCSRSSRPCTQLALFLRTVCSRSIEA
nr:hypothetical protein CFP56_55962 [Quercus suber]